MDNPEHAGPDGHGRLIAHVSECEACRGAPLPIEALAGLLDTVGVTVDATALSRHAFARLRPELERRAQAALWRRVALGILAALLPLPLVLAYDAYVLRLLYDLVSVLLPTTVAAYLVLSQIAFLVLLFALTYAAIPLLIVRDGRRLPSLS